MAIYVNKSGGFEQAEPVARECPHCGAHAQLLPVAVPSFAELTRTEPKNVGLVFRCAACGEPRFVRAAVRSIGAERVELAAAPRRSRAAARALPVRLPARQRRATTARDVGLLHRRHAQRIRVDVPPHRARSAGAGRRGRAATLARHRCRRATSRRDRHRHHGHDRRSTVRRPRRAADDRRPINPRC